MTQAEEASFPDWKLDSTMPSQGINKKETAISRTTALRFNSFIRFLLLLVLNTQRITFRNTTLQSMMNVKLSKQWFWHFYENGLTKTIQTIPHNL